MRRGSTDDGVTTSMSAETHMLRGTAGIGWTYRRFQSRPRATFSARSLLGRLSGRRNGSELCQQPQVVRDPPVLRGLAAGEPHDVDSLERDPLPRWRDVHECTLVGSAESRSDNDLVAVGNHLAHRDLEIRKSGPHRVAEL